MYPDLDWTVKEILGLVKKQERNFFGHPMILFQGF